MEFKSMISGAYPRTRKSGASAARGLKVLFSAAVFVLFAGLLMPCALPAQETGLRPVISQDYKSAITGLAVNPDGKFAVTGDADGRIVLHSLPEGGDIAAFAAHRGPVRALAFHPAGGYLLSAGEDGSLLLWDTATLSITAQYEGSGGPLSAAVFSADGTMIAAGGRDRFVYLYNFDKGSAENGPKFIQPAARYPDISPHTDSITGIAFSGDGKYLVSSGRDGTVRIVEIRTGLIRTIIRENRGIAAAVAVEQEKFLIACAFQDGTITLYDGKGDAVRSFRGHKASVSTLALSPEGVLLASGDVDGNMMLWEVNTGKLAYAVELRSSAISAALFLPFSNRILVADAEGTLTAFDEEAGTNIEEITRTKTSVVSVAAAGDGERFALGLSDAGIQYWDLKQGRPVRYLSGSSGSITAVDVSPDGGRIAAAAGNEVTIWDTFTGKPLGAFGGHADTVQSLKFLEEGAAVVSGGRDFSARVWNTEDFTERYKVNTSPRAYVTNLLASPFNTFVYSGGLYGLSMWDLKDGNVLETIPASLEDGSASAIHPKGIFVATAGKNEPVKIWDSFTGFVYASFGLEQGVRTPLQWSPDGGMLLTGSAGGDLLLWDTAAEKIIQNFSVEEGRVASAVFLRNGTLVLGNLEDGTVHIWKSGSEKPVLTIYALGGGDWAAFAEDGRFDCSRGGMKKFLFVKGLDAYKPRYFAQSLFTPNLAALALQTETGGRTSADLTREKLSASILLSPPPDMYLEHKASADWRESGKADLLVHVRDTGGGFDHVRIFHNGKLVRDSGMLSPGSSPGDKIFRFLVPLLPGENEFYAAASSGAGLEAETNPVSVLWEPRTAEVPDELPPPDLYAVIIGAGTYENLRIKAAYPAVDGRAVADMLNMIRGKEGNGQIGEVYTYNFIEAAARKTEIMKALSEIAGKARPADMFLFYYAGCYTSMDGQGIFLLPGAQGAGPFGSRGRELSVSAAELSGALADIQARSQLLLLDSLRPPLIEDNVFTAPESAEEKSLIILGESTGINIAAALGSDPFSADLPELGSGVFTYLLLNALKLDKEAAGPDRELGITEFLSYMETRYPQETFKVLGRERYPVIFGNGYDMFRGGGK